MWHARGVYGFARDWYPLKMLRFIISKSPNLTPDCLAQERGVAAAARGCRSRGARRQALRRACGERHQDLVFELAGII